MLPRHWDAPDCADGMLPACCDGHAARPQELREELGHGGVAHEGGEGHVGAVRDHRHGGGGEPFTACLRLLVVSLLAVCTLNVTLRHRHAVRLESQLLAPSVLLLPCPLRVCQQSVWHGCAQGVSQEKRVVATTGKLDAKRHLSDNAEKLMSFNIVQNLATMLDTVVF